MRAMLAPVLIEAPTETPVSLAEAKAHCRVNGGDDDALITALIAAATQHVDGWTGVLGRALVTQTWRQDYPDLSHCGLRLPLGPVASVSGVTYLDAAGLQHTLPTDQYTRVVDALGAIIMPASATVLWPLTACRPVAASVTFVAGTAAADVPAPIKAAILLIVGSLYGKAKSDASLIRETVDGVGTWQWDASGQADAAVMQTVNMLVAPLRRVGL